MPTPESTAPAVHQDAQSESLPQVKTVTPLVLIVVPDPAPPEAPPQEGTKHVRVLVLIRCANHHTPISGGICTKSHQVCPIEVETIVIEG
jgi:hypothetical protein